MRIIIIMMLLAMLAVPGATARAQGADEREVVVTGLGPDEEEAKKQAYRNAVQTVIGSLVVAETLVENDQLVQDKILSHSDGYVTKVQQVGQSKVMTNGLISVTMRVTVKIKQLREKLTAESITLTDMDGESLFAEKITKREEKKDAASIVKEALKDIPAAVIKAEADIKSAVIKDDGGMSQVTLPVKVYVDEEAYGKFVRSFISTLEGMGYKRKTGNITFKKYKNSRDYEYLHIDSRDAIRVIYGDNPFGDQSSTVHHNSHAFFLIGEVINLPGSVSRVSCFLIPIDIYMAIFSAQTAVFQAQSTTLFTVNVEITDADGAVIAKRELNYKYRENNQGYVMAPGGVRPSNRNKEEVGAGLTVIFPLVGYFDVSRSFNTMELYGVNSLLKPEQITFTLTDAELRQAKSVRCTVVNGE